MSDLVLDKNPITVEPVVKVVRVPNIGTKHAQGAIDKKLDNKTRRNRASQNTRKTS